MLFGLLCCVVSVLVFVLIYKLLPDRGWPYQADKILAFLLITCFVVTMVRVSRWSVLLLLIAVGCRFYYLATTVHYDLLSFYNDSRAILTDLETHKEGHFVYTGYDALPTDKEVLKAIDYSNPVVRDFAVQAVNKSFRKEQRRINDTNAWLLVQCLAVFKEIESKWNYVSDPANEEYFAKASESTRLLAGDCDDYSILMAGAIKSIGGTTRLVYIKGHIFPELLIGKKENMQMAGTLITHDLFPLETKNKKLNYQEDEKGNIWLNLDYTAHYPGGKFMGNQVIEYIYP